MSKRTFLTSEDFSALQGVEFKGMTLEEIKQVLDEKLSYLPEVRRGALAKKIQESLSEEG